MSENEKGLGGGVHEISKRRQQPSGPLAPPRTDAGAIIHGSPHGHGTRAAPSRIQAFQEQKKTVAARQAAQRQAESQQSARQAIDTEIRQLESKLQYLKRSRATLKPEATGTFTP